MRCYLRRNPLTLLIDVHENISIVQELGKSIPVAIQPLNANGWADFSWIGIDGKRIQIEHKQWNEFIAEFPAHVEEQLRRQITKSDEHYLLIEGWPLDTVYGVDTYSEEVSKKGTTYFRRSRTYGSKARPRSGLMQGICTWMDKMERLGVTTICTPIRRWMLSHITAIYAGTQRIEFIGWDRYHKPIVHPKSRNKHVPILMGVRGIGEVSALRLVEWYGSSGAAFRSSIEEMSEVLGWNGAVQFFKEIGADDAGG